MAWYTLQLISFHIAIGYHRYSLATGLVLRCPADSTRFGDPQDSKASMKHRLAFPGLTEYLPWATSQVQPWAFFLRNPDTLQPFNDWLWSRICMNDVPSLYLAMLTVVESLAPLGSSGVARSEEKASVFASISFALAIA